MSLLSVTSDDAAADAESDEMTALNERLALLEREMSEIKRKLDEKRVTQDERRSLIEGADEMTPKVHENSAAVQEMHSSIVNPDVHHLGVVNDYYKEGANFTWIIHDIAKFLSGNGHRKLYSPEFPLPGYPFKAQARLKVHHRDRVTFGLAFKDPTAARAKLKVRPIPNVFCTFKDQSGPDTADVVSHGHYSHVRPLLKYDAFDNYSFRPLTRSLLQAPPYSVDDTLSVAVHVESPAVAQLVHSYDGTLTWAIDRFRQRREREAQGFTEAYLSPYFYTSPNGYRVRVKVCVSGREEFKGEGVSVHVSFLNGLNDNNFSLSLLHHVALLFRSSYHKTTVTLFHPTKHYLSISRSEENGLRDYWMDMGTRAQIENLLYNDTLYYKLNVEEILRPILP